MVVVNCHWPGWGFRLLSYLDKQKEIVLVNADFQADERFLRDSAQRCGMTLVYHQESQTVKFTRDAGEVSRATKKGASQFLVS